MLGGRCCWLSFMWGLVWGLVRGWLWFFLCFGWWLWLSIGRWCVCVFGSGYSDGWRVVWCWWRIVWLFFCGVGRWFCFKLLVGWCWFVCVCFVRYGVWWCVWFWCLRCRRLRVGSFGRWWDCFCIGDSLSDWWWCR